MANNVLLNSIDHQDLKVLTERSKAYGDNVWYTQTFPQEFRSVQAYYPIFFNKDPNTISNNIQKIKTPRTLMSNVCFSTHHKMCIFSKTTY